MSDVTRILRSIEGGDPEAAEVLLPLVYDELRKLAAVKMAGEKPGQTLQATALVHEAYMRLVSADEKSTWDNRGHFFAAAAEAMRRILIDLVRRKQSQRHGGDHERRELRDEDLTSIPLDHRLLDLDTAEIGSLGRRFGKTYKKGRNQRKRANVSSSQTHGNPP